MRKVQAVLVPLLILAALVALAWLQVDVPIIARFDFIWDVILGAALGLGLALLPQLSGFAPRKNALTSMFWVCGFITLLVVFYQYMSLVADLHIAALSFLSSPGPRMRLIEGALLGYCSFVAGRGKV